MNKENLISSKIKEFLSFYSNNSSLDLIIDTSNYDLYTIRCKNGSKIHIKKKNRGKFTLYCGGNVTEECIRKGKNSSSATIRKRAIFADNSRKWKH